MKDKGILSKEMETDLEGGPSMRQLDHYAKLLANRRIGRREFMGRALALGVTTALATSTASKALQAATPRKGGTVRCAYPEGGPDDQMDPPILTSSLDYTRGRATYNGLTQTLDNMTLHPELASEWSSNSNATEYTFKIQKGVHFHDGSPLTADDVVWSMNRHLGDDSISILKPMFAQVTEWRKIDSHTVKAFLDSPDSDLPIKLSEKQAKIAKADTTDFKKGNGTGPYVLESFEPGIKSLHVRNENYWREGPNLDALELLAITDPHARVNALIAGDMQMVADIEAKSIRLVEDADGVRIISTPSGYGAEICILKNTPPGENDDFVKGMQFIQDRERIVRSIMEGNAIVGNDQPIAKPYGADHCAELAQRPYDPDQAKWHLNKSGVTSAELFVAPVCSGIEDASLLMQANLKKIGFDLKLKRVPADGYWGAVWMKEPMNVASWNMRATANMMMSIQFAPGAPWNDTFWNNERFGQLLKMQLAETDPDNRHEMLCEMQTLIHNESGIVIPYHLNLIDGVDEKIQGIPNSPLGPLGGYEWPEFAWMDT